MAGHIPDSFSVDWCTEDRIVERVHLAFGGRPNLDPCSNPHSRVGAVESYELPGSDGLILPWKNKTFVNPPFGKGWWKLGIDGQREYIWTEQFRKLSVAEKKSYQRVSIADWIENASLTGMRGGDVIGLIPAYPGTSYWHSFVWPTARAIFFPKGRLHFRLVYTKPDGETYENTGPAPMDCAMPFWGGFGGREAFQDAFDDLGKVLVLR